MPAFTIPHPRGHRLDLECHYNTQEQWYTVDTLDAARRLDFADDLAPLLSHSHSQMQDKTTRLETT